MCGAKRDEGHDWEGCKCSRCGWTRNEQHKWVGCKCTGCDKTRDEGHVWGGCWCSVCGKKWRDQEHNWDGCGCTNCKQKRDEGHRWEGCKCCKCGRTRDEDHTWQGCRCSRCDKHRDEDHVWSGCLCSVCGKTRDEGHNWYRCKCQRCRKTRDEEHDWSANCEECAQCAKTRDEKHEWADGKCSRCKADREDLAKRKVMAQDLLSSDQTTREGALVAALRFAGTGNRRGIDALASAIRQRAGDRSVELPRNFRARASVFGPLTAGRPKDYQAHEGILGIARRNAICQEAERVGELMPRLRVDDSAEIRSLLNDIREVGGDGQVHDFQLVGTYWQANVDLRKFLYSD